MSPVKTKVNAVAALANALPNWDPSKHPRDRQGQFLEVGDVVSIYGPAATGGFEKTGTGTVKGGHFEQATGRMFIAVETPEGETKWFRPKQLETVEVKASLAPQGPIPEVGSKETDFDWANGTGDPMSIGEVAALAALGAPDTTEPEPPGDSPLGLPLEQFNIPAKYPDASGSKDGIEYEIYSTPNGWKAVFLGGESDYMEAYDVPPDVAAAGTLDVWAEAQIDSGNVFGEVDGIEEDELELPAATLSPEPELEDDFGDLFPDPKPGATVYEHPQGAKIYVNPDGSMEAYGANGKPKKTSATPEKLAAGHGQWKVAEQEPVQTHAEALGLVGFPPDPDAVIPEPDVSAPEPPAGPAPIKLPAGKTPADVLGLIVTSASNKNLDAATVKNYLDTALLESDPDIAHGYLAKAMTTAKLGGKQRARYKQLLDMHLGIATPAPAAKPKAGNPTITFVPSKPGELPPVNGMTKPKGGKVLSYAAGKAALMVPVASQPWQQYTGYGGTTQGAAKKARIQQELTDRTMSSITDAQIEAMPTAGFSEPARTVKIREAIADQAWKTDKKHLRRDSNGGWALVSGSPTSPPGIDGSYQRELTEENLRLSLREIVMGDLIAQWAATSNDSNPRSLAVQDAVAAEFGLTDFQPWSTPHSVTAAYYAKNGALLRSFVRAMYELTQEDLKKRGITHVTLKRGMHLSKRPGDVGETVRMKLRPASSFTSETAQANKFGQTHITGIIPIERILGSAHTGFGCLHEIEWVTLGGEDEYTLSKVAGNYHG